MGMVDQSNLLHRDALVCFVFLSRSQKFYVLSISSAQKELESTGPRDFCKNFSDSFESQFFRCLVH